MGLDFILLLALKIDISKALGDILKIIIFKVIAKCKEPSTLLSWFV
jgi:hypothetical protein